MNSYAEKPSKGNILIVDDALNNLNLLSAILHEENYHVRKATSGQMALATCNVELPDLILLDVMMPDIDGYKVCQQLKANPNTQTIPVIFISALDDALDKVKAFEVGGVDYITKPFQISEVLARVENQLMIQRLHNQLMEQNQQLLDLNSNLEKLVQQKTQQLIEQEKTALIGRLTQGIVHNFKNPLQTIMICSDLLELKIRRDTDFEYEEINRDIKIAAIEIQQIMDNLLIKSVSDRQLSLSLLNLNQVIEQEFTLLNANLHFKHRINKKYKLDENLPAIPLIYSHISQVIHNLINNALDAMWDCKVQELTACTHQDESYIYLEIHDTGCGIPLEDISQIFDPFYTSKPAKGSEKQLGEPTGTGLGLYTCIELLKPFGGKIKVNSKVGQGSQFIVSFPKANPSGSFS
ncbi:hybrid sensor histidine kinase/response regulator [Desertifilum sp. FACHB-1129]|uniref:histidine kinase n=1 Tax=Desertifilum tharense IPPAS B-1220 TaxID=1781255 RepID=A0A1E5QPM8_9CYAN|nr:MULTISPECIES: hybrid sensor histidine kinase/response regulator [Desertifilum]MDA0209846.1 hybrid sensor histidine kinase/response regulator [Cyanobacteria bacterium FC1]MBD2310664.1 hybrid sensor histidine kinase/response regulator [Desertifilum sp. FACHB-1129]MBD2320701.1 hybrid sensor histidine kinase/response regulator [Desertifilum sp. FACHB-866]MBD2330829.1 hybrid sensor histidine kinase/response regulator [Desertifilum sp. FACHB-868]OEJ76625.1 hybrid sensor histidine kinase/response 